MDSAQAASLTTAIAAFVTAFASLVLGMITWRETRSKRLADVHDTVNRLYDQVVVYRRDVPDVLRLSREWAPSCIDAAYVQASDRDRQWALYYGYVELCISYCNAALYARAEGLLGDRAFRDQHKNLVKLMLTEHYPAIDHFINTGKYISPLITAFVSEQRDHEQWEWRTEYELLVREERTGDAKGGTESSS